ncbi:MAG TPA: hypothetical protein VFS65_00760 [Candidatus Saccharimonadales bacterium]|nr:hypothetical protein [Candidatus Saccharimonadales bacterium]
MNEITQSLIKKLAQKQEVPVVSIYVPTHRLPSSPNMREDQTRFKNLIRKARDMWSEQSDDPRIEKIYNQLEVKLNNLEFWQHTTEGMAIFADYEDVGFYHLPIECEERVYVGDSYDITPLLLILTLNQPYYVLVLAMHNTKLLYGDMYTLNPVDIEFPSSPEDALSIDEMFSGSNTIRSPQSGRSGTNDVISPHGQGDSREAGREERLQYFRIIDDTIMNSNVVDTSRPILVAGTDSEVGDYHAVSQLSTLMHTYISGNHTNTSLPELQKLAWQIIYSDIVDARSSDVLTQYYELTGQHKSSHDIKDITEAAQSGRVATLLVGMIHTTADSIRDSVDAVVQVITFLNEYDRYDLVSLVRSVYEQGGDVRGVDVESMPEHAAVAALYRYA